MKVLIADDHAVNRKLLRVLLESDGYETKETVDGRDTLDYLEAVTTPTVGLIDWEMPFLHGADVCRKIRLKTDAPPLFLIMLTVRSREDDIVEGLSNGANDYVTKPFGQSELLARVRLGVQTLALQQDLMTRVNHLDAALAASQKLSGLLSICSYCKSIRKDQSSWQRIESFICEHAPVQFSHGFCPECNAKHLHPEIEALRLLPPGDPLV